MPSAEIITIGTELLLGETADTNTRTIARCLRELGVDLFRTQTIGDNAGRITATVREALGRADIVITTGGLGPTVDDPTRQAIAEAAGTELEFHPELWEQITARIARYGRQPTENQKRQAYIPRGARVIPNPVGTAPAFAIESEGPKAVISLPGVPSEMETLLAEAVTPYLQERFHLHEVIRVRTLHVSGLGEGLLDDRIGEWEKLANPTVGLTAHSGIVDIRIAVKSPDPESAGKAIAEVEEQIRAQLGEHVYGADEDTLEGVALQAVNRRGWTLACLESGLEGTLPARLARTKQPAYRGGRSLPLEPEQLLEKLAALQQELEASAGLGVILTARGQEQSIQLALRTPQGTVERHLTYGGHPGNAPRWASNMALDLLRRQLESPG